MATKSASIGPAMPAEATAEGGLNATTPPVERTDKGRTVPSDGPIMGDNGAYLPAEYEIAPGMIRQDR